MATLLNKFQIFNAEQSLISDSDKVLLAVSGGVDSVVLCHLMSHSKIDFEIAHCNFDLRGEESETDAVFTQELAESYNIKHHVKKFNTTAFADENHLSIQMAARELRYQWFNELLDTTDLTLLATAHHANDQVETVLFNMTKGTGIAGLRGIEPKSKHTIRPLLFATKEEILAYANENHLFWREDISNESDKYHRNQIRHHVIPALAKINPSLENTFFKNSIRFNALEQLLKAKVDQVTQEYVTESKGQYKLDMSWHDVNNGGLAVLESLLKPFGFNLDQCINIIDSLASGSGNQFYSDQYELTADRRSIFIDPKQNQETTDTFINKEDREIIINKQLLSVKILNEKVHFNDRVEMAFLDADLVRFPIKVRKWQEGDRFVPLGMRSEKKVSDFMIDEKIPVNLKKRLLIFESNHEIIWIGGYRISDRYKITKKTKTSLIIKLEENA